MVNTMNTIESQSDFWQVSDNMRELCQIVVSLNAIAARVQELANTYDVNLSPEADESVDLTSTVRSVWGRLAYLISTTPNDLL